MEHVGHTLGERIGDANALAPVGLPRSPWPTRAPQGSFYFVTLLGVRMGFLTDRVGMALLQSCYLQRQSACLINDTPALRQPSPLCLPDWGRMEGTGVNAGKTKYNEKQQ